MTNRFNPILNAVTADRPAYAVRPGVAFVYTDAAGAVVDEVGNGVFGWFTRMRWTRHCVDVGDQHRYSVPGKLPAAEQSAFFDVELDLGFRVADAKEVVRRNLTGADQLAIRSVWRKMRAVARGFPVDSAAEAELEVNDHLSEGYRLAEGIEIFDVTVRINPDATAIEHGARKRAAESHQELNNQGLELDLSELAMRVLADHPQDAEKVLHLLGELRKLDAQKQDARDKRADDLLRYLIDRGVLQQVDIERIRDILTQNVRHSAGPLHQRHPGWGEEPVLATVVLQEADDRPAA